ncbi:HAUS augmin-like complex subunit 3 [Melanerpes formicivorus]|uniref:HAUS augmin-like complex subunit 3 n=1 Tax=Melanerpes formicivorus TaxID=211600 RepID=UPI00358F5C41
MLSQRHSEAFPLHTVSRAAEFLVTLRMFYPQADTLCEKDFEWLFDCPQTKQFLEWFCSTVGEENVLTPAEVEAYDALLAAGKPILEGDALEQALQTIYQLPGMIPDNQDPTLEALQQELEELQEHRDRQLCRHRRLQAWTAKMQKQLRCLEQEEKTVTQDLRKAWMDLKVEIFQTRAVLGQISKDAKQMAEWYRAMGEGRPPALLCEMDLGPYLELEQQATKAFESFVQQALPGIVQAPNTEEASAQGGSTLQEWLDSDWEIPEGRRALYQEGAKIPHKEMPASQKTLVQGSRAELLVERRNKSVMLSMGDEEERDGSQEVTDATWTTMLKGLGTDGDEKLQDRESCWKELIRMETAHICAQREAIVMSSKVEGHCAALEWTQRTWKTLQENQQAAEAELQGQAATLQKQLQALRCDIVHILTHQLPPLLRAEAQASALPVLQRQLSLEDAHLQHLARKQEVAAAWLLSQHSRLDLLQLQLKAERKELDQKAAQLEEMERAMKEAQTMLQEVQAYYKDACSSQKDVPRTWIDPKEHTAVRLWDILLGKDQEKQQFRSYKALAAQCSKLVENKRVLEAQLAAPMPQLPALESSTGVLYRLLYNSSNQLQLSPREITNLIKQLTTVQDNLYQRLTDLQNELKGKCRSLENPLLQTERNLYVYFFCNQDWLRQVVEKLEKKAAAASRQPQVKLPHAKK